MPCDYSKYPSNWKTEIRPSIMERARGCCEWCGLPHMAIVQRHKGNPAIVARPIAVGDKTVLEAHQRRYDRYYADGSYQRPIRIILTIAHLDHDTANNDPSNLAALCQRCHLRYDSRLHAENSTKTRKGRAG